MNELTGWLDIGAIEWTSVKGFVRNFGRGGKGGGVAFEAEEEAMLLSSAAKGAAKKNVAELSVNDLLESEGFIGEWAEGVFKCEDDLLSESSDDERLDVEPWDGANLRSAWAEAAVVGNVKKTAEIEVSVNVIPTAANNCFNLAVSSGALSEFFLNVSKKALIAYIFSNVFVVTPPTPLI